MEKQEERRKMIVKFHAMLRGAGLGEEEKRELLCSYGVESTKELTMVQLNGLCRLLKDLTSDAEKKRDKMRKRVLRAVCQLAERMEGAAWEQRSVANRMTYARAIVCRAAMVENFNRIGVDRLRSLAYAFEKQVQDLDGVVAAAEAVLREAHKDENEN